MEGLTSINVSDGVVTLRPTTNADAPLLLAGRDATFHRFLGDGGSEPRPFACIVVDGRVVGWIDHDSDREWLKPNEVNVGYNVFAKHRGKGFATRALLLLVQLLAGDEPQRVATLLISTENADSLSVARRAGFELVGPIGDSLFWRWNAWTRP